MNANLKTRVWYSCGIILLIALGLLSRKISVIPPCVGDALWAMVVYCCWRIVLVKKSTLIAALAALVSSFAVEFSQLITWAPLTKLRSTLIGHLLLGQGFLWSDLLAYAIGIALLFLFTEMLRRIVEKRAKTS